MHKDNEKVPLTKLNSDAAEVSELQPFTPDLMVRCEECLRANPPTRVNCLYCGAILPLTETTVNLQKPTLRPLEKWEQGYNNILLPHSANLAESVIAEAANLLKMTPVNFRLISESVIPLPLARAGTSDEAALIEGRLSRLGIKTEVVADSVLGLDDGGPVKVRSLEIDEQGLKAYQTPDVPAVEIGWSEFTLFVVGRLVFKRVELREEKARSENRILDSSEFFRDEFVVDLYIRDQDRPFRIMAHSFDFSCLGDSKGLVAEENLTRLLTLLRERSRDAHVDDSYKTVRKALEIAWPSEQQNESSGLRRERPGKFSLGSVNERDNEKQFSKFSRLRHFLQKRAGNYEAS